MDRGDVSRTPLSLGSCQDREASPSVRKASKLAKTLIYHQGSEPRVGIQESASIGLYLVSLRSCTCEYLNLALLVYERTGASSFEET